MLLLFPEIRNYIFRPAIAKYDADDVQAAEKRIERAKRFGGHLAESKPKKKIMLASTLSINNTEVGVLDLLW